MHRLYHRKSDSIFLVDYLRTLLEPLRLPLALELLVEAPALELELLVELLVFVPLVEAPELELEPLVELLTLLLEPLPLLTFGRLSLFPVRPLFDPELAGRAELLLELVLLLTLGRLVLLLPVRPLDALLSTFGRLSLMLLLGLGVAGAAVPLL